MKVSFLGKSKPGKTEGGKENVKNPDKGLLVILSGPSGCGKGTVLHQVMEQYENAVVSVSMTTREPRPGEVDGVHYFFVTEEEFKRHIRKKEMLEYAEYSGYYYGTPKNWVEEQRNAGRDVILEIEVKGGKQVIDKCPDAVSIFLTSPSLEELERRLRYRGTEDEKKIRKRMDRAVWELNQMDLYKYVIVNDEVPEAAAQFMKIVKKEHKKRKAALK